jgi:hypothetical protein
LGSPRGGETLADPGGICLSRPVFDQVRNKLDVPLVPVRGPVLKHVQAGMDVYRVTLPWEQEAPSPKGGTPARADVGRPRPRRARRRDGLRSDPRFAALVDRVGLWK